MFEGCESDRCDFDIRTIETLETNRVFEVRIAAAYTPTGEAEIFGYEFATSLFSTPIKIHTFYEPLKVYNHTVELINVNDTVISLDETFSIREVFYNDQAMNSSDFRIVNNTLVISNQFIETLNVGLNQVTIITNIGRIDFNLYKLEA
jgi:hypothetical protein